MEGLTSGLSRVLWFQLNLVRRKTNMGSTIMGTTVIVPRSVEEPRQPEKFRPGKICTPIVYQSDRRYKGRSDCNKVWKRAVYLRVRVVRV